MKKGVEMQYLDGEEAFENAIKRGLKNPEEYMYMYSIGKKDYFKHIDTRNYIGITREREKNS